MKLDRDSCPRAASIARRVDGSSAIDTTCFGWRSVGCAAAGPCMGTSRASWLLGSRKSKATSPRPWVGVVKPSNPPHPRARGSGVSFALRTGQASLHWRARAASIAETGCASGFEAIVALRATSRVRPWGFVWAFRHSRSPRSDTQISGLASYCPRHSTRLRIPTCSDTDRCRLSPPRRVGILWGLRTYEVRSGLVGTLVVRLDCRRWVLLGFEPSTPHHPESQAELESGPVAQPG